MPRNGLLAAADRSNFVGAATVGTGVPWAWIVPVGAVAAGTLIWIFAKPVLMLVPADQTAKESMSDEMNTAMARIRVVFSVIRFNDLHWIVVKMIVTGADATK